jgi:hypothetical protein
VDILADFVQNSSNFWLTLRHLQVASDVGDFNTCDEAGQQVAKMVLSIDDWCVVDATWHKPLVAFIC